MIKYKIKYIKHLFIKKSTLNGCSTRPIAITSHIWSSDVVLVIDSVRCSIAVGVPCNSSMLQDSAASPIDCREKD